MNPVLSKINAATMPMTARHYWIVFVASLGQMVGTAVATIAGIIIPLINIVRHPELSTPMQGLIGAADLIGIMIGSVVFGRLSDKYGYLLFFRLCPALIFAAALAGALSDSVALLVVSLFFIGFGIGGEYSLDSDYTSELMPVKWRQVMTGVVKTMSALGNIIAAGLGFLFIIELHDAARWPNLMWIIACIGALMFLTRIKFYQSPKWLYDHGRKAEAEQAIKDFLGPDVELPEDFATAVPVKDKVSDESDVSDVSEGRKESFFKKYFNQLMLSGVPWACEGLGVYGIGVFIPILVMALGIEHINPGEIPVLHVAQSVKTTLWISCIILPGFIIGVWLTHKGHSAPRLQTMGFWACAISLVVLLFSYHFGWPKWISLISFMAFELFLNIGPHLGTYLIPPKIYPVAVRGQGTGIAASIGKAGAVLGVFVVPILLKAGGAVLVLGVSAAVMAIGAIVTSVYGRKVAENMK